MTTDHDHEISRVRHFYDTVYYKDLVQTISASPHFKRLARRISISKGQNILDVACGTGRWLLTTTKLGALPSGVDISSKAIEVCRLLMPDGVFHAGQAEMLLFDDKRFDIVSCLGALEHFREPSLALREMVRVAKEDALFLLLVPNADFLTRRLGLYGGTEQVDVKEDVRTLSEWQILFETSGIQIIDRWRDLHVLSRGWIFQGNWYQQSFRLMQAIALMVWPLKWQYQVYFLGKKKLTA